MADRTHDFHEVKIATGDGANLGVVKNKALAWKRVVERLVTPTVDQSITFAQYQALDDNAKARKKMTSFITGGQFKGGKRRSENIQSRSLIMLDVDSATPAQIEWITDGLSAILEYRLVAYTTRSHCREKPKYRFVLPLWRKVNYLEFHAIVRVLASRLFETVEESMTVVDPVSYRMAQLMYLPIISKDQDWDVLDNPGKLLDPDEFLGALDYDWTDASLLPYDEKLGAGRPTDSHAKAEIPTEKPGIIGAFCRAYDVEDAIAEFLSDIYVEGDAGWSKPRYTYVPGGGANGAIVEDDGLFLYSHHGSDPCGERLTHSFDLVRIHKFGHLDKDAREGTTQTQMPSYRAMAEWAERLPAVASEIAAGVFDKFDFGFEDEDEDEAPKPAPMAGKSKLALKVEALAAPKPDDIASTFDQSASEDDDLLGEAPTAKPKEDRSWLERLDVSEKGEIKTTLHNTALILSYDKRVAGSIEYNDHTHDITIRKRLQFSKLQVATMPVPGDGYGRVWQDHDDIAIRQFFATPKRLGGYALKVAKMDVNEGVMAASIKSRYHPIRNYLADQEWDGVARVDRLFIDWLGVPDTAYAREAARSFLVAAVARVMEPGCKFDCVPILGGAQGKRKSTFAQVLGRGRWFRELSSQFDNTGRMIESMQGGWINEIGELSGFARNEVEVIKQFIAARSDQYRMAYAKRVGWFPRQVVFIGTTNRREYLKDQTGNRRFWPLDVNVDVIDIDGLEKSIDRIWAEALTIYKDMRKRQPLGDLWLDLVSPEAKAIASGEQQARMVESVEDVLLEQIMDWLDTPCTKAEALDPEASVFEIDDDAPKGHRNFVTVRDVFVHVMEGRGSPGSRDTKVISDALGKLQKWARPNAKDNQVRRGSKKPKGYVRVGSFERNGLWSPIRDAVFDDEDEALLG